MNIKNKGFICALFVVLFLLPFLSCGDKGGKGGKYADYRMYLSEYKDHMIEYGKKMEAAQNAQQAADAITWYFNKLIELADRAEVLDAKYPEIDEKNLPPELQADFDEVKQYSEKLAVQTAPILYKYMDDKRVLDAFDKVLKTLQGGEKNPKTTIQK